LPRPGLARQGGILVTVQANGARGKWWTGWRGAAFGELCQDVVECEHVWGHSRAVEIRSRLQGGPMRRAWRHYQHGSVGLSTGRSGRPRAYAASKGGIVERDFASVACRDWRAWIRVNDDCAGAVLTRFWPVLCARGRIRSREVAFQPLGRPRPELRQNGRRRIIDNRLLNGGNDPRLMAHPDGSEIENT